MAQQAPDQYIPNKRITVEQANLQYAAHGIARPWSGDSIPRMNARLAQARRYRDSEVERRNNTVTPVFPFLIGSGWQ